MNDKCVNNIDIEESIHKSVNQVYKVLGYGQSETVYRRALALELLEKGLKIQEEFIVPITYITEKGVKYQIGTYRLDIIIDNQVILELKTLTKDIVKDSKEYSQLQRYLKILPCRGYLVNFGKTGVQILP